VTSSRDGTGGGNPPATVVLEAGRLVGGGRALAHHDGRTWMVAGALPGERVEVRELGRRAGIVEGRAVAVEGAAHPARAADPCPHAPHCGGCDWPHIEPAAATRLKAQAAADAARGHPAPAALIAAATIHHSPLAYRLRARLHWDPTHATLGFYEPRSHAVTPIPGCRILSPALMTALPALAAALRRRCPVRVDVEWLEGSDPTRGVAAIRRARGGPARLDPGWLPTPGELGTAAAGCHLLAASGAAHGGWGEREVRFDLPTPLRVPIGAFFQGNRHLLRTLFDRVAELAGAGDEPVFDLHAGVGFLAAAVRSRGSRSMDLIEPQLEAARAAARNLPEARVAIGVTAEHFVMRQPASPPEALVITDPPRSGMTPPLRQALARWRPRRVLMLGCDPATWARDAASLCDHGYRIAALELFDLFPSTHHVEILALLERE
jgi:23S rRNA (uracil1939-C5)-methyltransferase